MTVVSTPSTLSTYYNAIINSNNWSTATTGTSTPINPGVWYTTNTHVTCPDENFSWVKDRDKELKPGTIHKLPDGSKLVIDFNGNYEIIDISAKVTYQANNNREFNNFVNASDVLEAFIKDVGALGVKQNEVFGLPIEHFINWLIIRAGEKDGDKVDRSAFEKEIKRLTMPL